MKQQTMEKLYAGVMIACFVICLILLISMLVGKPLLQRVYPHAPTMRDTILPPQMQEGEEETPQQPQEDRPAGQTGRLTLTETALQHTLLTALPEEFPVSALEADIEAEGTVELKLEVGRDKLTDYLKQAGMKLSLKEKLFLRLLPKTIEASCLLRLTSGEEGGLALLVPEKLALNEHSIKVAALPQELLDAANSGLQAALEATGLNLGKFVCTDDAIVFS